MNNPLCAIPSNLDDARACTVAAQDTLNRAISVLQTLIWRNENDDEKYGESLILETIQNAVIHARDLIRVEPA